MTCIFAFVQYRVSKLLALGRSVELGAETYLTNQLLLTLFVNGSNSRRVFERRLKRSELFHALSDIHLEDDDDEDVPIQLSTLVVTRVNKVDLPTGYKSVGDGTVYNEVWDKTAEVKKSEREKI